MRQAMPGNLTEASSESRVGAIGALPSLYSFKVSSAIRGRVLHYLSGLDVSPAQPTVAAGK